MRVFATSVEGVKHLHQCLRVEVHHREEKEEEKQNNNTGEENSTGDDSTGEMIQVPRFHHHLQGSVTYGISVKIKIPSPGH